MNGRNNPGKETVEKDDGRYIIFYSFDESEGEEDKDGNEARESGDTSSLNGRHPGG